MQCLPKSRTRKVAVLIADGFDLAPYNAIKGALDSAGAIVVTIGCRRSKVMPASGNSIIPDHFLEGSRSTLFDALLIPPGDQHVKTLLGSGRAIHYIREASVSASQVTRSCSNSHIDSVTASPSPALARGQRSFVLPFLSLNSSMPRTLLVM